MERMAWEEYAEAEKYDSTFDKSCQIPYEEEETENEQNAKGSQENNLLAAYFITRKRGNEL